MVRNKRNRTKKRVKRPARTIPIPKYKRISKLGNSHFVTKHSRHLPPRMIVRTVILPANESTSPLTREETATQQYIKRHSFGDVSKETSPAAAVIQKDRRERRGRIITAHDLNLTLSEIVYPEDPVFQEINAAGRVYGLVATPQSITGVHDGSIDLKTKFDDQGKPRGFDRTPAKLMPRDKNGRIRQVDMSVVGTDQAIGLTPAFESEFALSNFKDDREEFTQLLSLYMHWMEKNNRGVKQAVRTHRQRGGWNKNIGVTKIRGKNVIFLTSPTNKELAGTAYQLPITHMAIIKKVPGQTVQHGNVIMPKYDIDRESEAGDKFIVAGQEVKYGAVFSNIGGLKDTAENRQYALDYRYRYPTVFTKLHPETITQIQEGSRRVAKRDRGKNTKRYQRARRQWAEQTQNAIKNASPAKKAELDKIKQLHVDPVYWEKSDYRIIEAVLGRDFIGKYGITPPPVRDAYGLSKHKGGRTNH